MIASWGGQLVVLTYILVCLKESTGVNRKDIQKKTHRKRHVCTRTRLKPLLGTLDTPSIFTPSPCGPEMTFLGVIPDVLAGGGHSA